MEFSTVKLKKTAPPKDTSVNVSTLAQQDAKERQYQKSITDTNVDQWYPYLQPHTILSWFVTMTVDHAKVFRKNYLYKEKGGAPLDEQETNLLDDLKKKIDVHLKEISPGKGAFFRCSTRSPKDSHVSIARCKEILVKELNPNSTPNDKLKALLKASLGGMKVHTAQEALDLLCSSERIYEDLGSELDKKIENFHQLIIIREWVDIPIQHEYRGFVHNKSLNAISQYYHTIFFDDLKAVWDDNIQTIQNFFNSTISSIIPLTSYIIDFAVLPSGEILVIELNPFSIATDSNLFSWIEDKKILEEGPFTKRMTMAPFEVTSGVEMAIQELLNG